MVTPAIYNGFTFDGVDSKQYGVFITDVKVFGAPVRDVESVSIPGRNGDLLIDHGRYENIDVVYSAVIHDIENFTTIMANFRAALASKTGYKRLSDDINIGEYRLATFKDGLDVSTLNKKTGQFDITFNCKPQRYLLTGETPRVLVQGMTPKNPQTESGAIVSIESDGGDAVTSLIAQIEPVQSGSGDPSPTNVRLITGWTACNVNVAGKNLIGFKSLLDKWGSGYTDLGDGSYNVISTGTGYREPFRFASKDIDVTLSGEITQLSGSAGWRLQLLNSSGEAVATLGSGSTTLSGKGCKLRLNFSTGGEGANFKNIQLELGTSVTAYEPYTGNIYPVSFGDAGTVYGGELDVVTGVLTVDRAIIDLGERTWALWGSATDQFICEPISDMPQKTYNSDLSKFIATNITKKPQSAGWSGMGNWHFGIYQNRIVVLADTTLSDFKTKMSGQKMVYELAAPQTYNLTAQQVELLTGQNHVWADTGNITLTYGADPYKVVNPTLFESKPLLMVTGRGTLSVGDVTMTITGTASQVLYIDCDIMEVYSITDGQMQPQNSLVTISGNEYPALQPGATQITLGSGITQVVITPRWWRI